MAQGTKQETKPRRVNVVMYPAEDRAAQELAEREHGGNVSHLVRTLILREYERIAPEDEGREA